MAKLRSYTKEFKEERVRLALKSPSIDKTAKSLGVTWLDNSNDYKYFTPIVRK